MPQEHDPKKLYAILQEEIKAGRLSLAEANRAVQELSEYNSLPALESALNIPINDSMLLGEGARDSGPKSRLQILKESAMAAGLGAADMLTFGFSDEIAGVGRGAVTGIVPGGEGFREGYEHGRDVTRDNQATAREEYPVQHIAGQVGGVLPFLGAAALRGGAAAGAAATKPLLQRVIGGGIRGGAAGAAGGAAYGVGSGDTPAERVTGGLEGSLFGGAAGGALGAATPALSAAAQRWLSAPLGKARREAKRLLEYSLEKAGYTPRKVIAELEALGPEAAMADVDDVFRQHAAASKIMKEGGETAEGVVGQLEERGRQAGHRAAEDLRTQSKVGKPKRVGGEDPSIAEFDITPERRTVSSQRTQLESELEAVREKAYRPLEKMYDEVTSEGLDALIEGNPKIKNKLLSEIDPQWKPGKPLSFRQAQELEQFVREEATSGENLTKPFTSRKWREAADELREELGDLMPGTDKVPGYREANKQYRAVSKRMDALDEGYKMANKSSRDIDEAFGKLSEEARDDFRTGMYEYWDEQLHMREGAGGGVARLVEADTEVQKRLRPLFESDEELTAFVKRMQKREQSFKRTGREVLGGSPTAERQEMIQRLRGRAGWTPTKEKALGAVMDWLAPATRKSDDVVEQLLNVYLSQGDEAARKLAAMFNARFNRLQNLQHGLIRAGRGAEAASDVGPIYTPRGTMRGQVAARNAPSLFDLEDR